MLKTLYKYELKKLFLSKVNLAALAVSLTVLVFLAVSSFSEGLPESGETAGVLEGRAIDGAFFEELAPALETYKGVTQLQVAPGYEAYTPILNMMRQVTGDEVDLARFSGMGFYELRRQRIEQRFEKQGLTEAEKAYWEALEAEVGKPFIYHEHRGPANLLKSFQALGFFILLLSAVGLSGVYARETADNMNQLLLCSRHGKKDLYLVKFAAGITWILAAAALMILALLVPIWLMFGMEGMGEMLQLVKPLSMLPYSIGKMIAVCLVIFFLAAVLFAAVTMLLSVVTQNALAVNCGLLCYLIVDLFGSVPDRFRLLQTVWNLRPNAILMNTGFVNYRLIGLAGRFFLSFEAAAVVYIAIAAAALVIGRVRYGRLQVEK